MRRRIGALLLCLALLAAGPFFTAAGAVGDDEEIIKIEGDVFVLYDGFAEEVVVPEGITRIAKGAFAGSSSWLKRVVLPSTLKVIEDYAFSNSYQLAEVQLPAGLEYIGDGAFQNTKIADVTIPAGVTCVGKEAFGYCHYLGDVTVLSADTELGEGAFFYSGLTSLALPAGLKTIPPRMVESCDKLTAIALPESLTAIGERAFDKCKGLEELNIPAAVTTFGEYAFRDTPWLAAQGGELYANGVLVQGRVEDGAAVFPDGVTAIGPGAFRGQADLTTAEVPDSVTSIGANAFQNCQALTRLRLPGRLEQLGDAAFQGDVSLTSVVVPATEKIGTGVFSVCKGLTTAIMLDGSKGPGVQMFSSCESLEKVILPGDATEIGAHAFGSCWKMKSLYLPDSVYAIGRYALAGSYSSICLPAALQNVGESPFAGCQQLKTMYYTTAQPPSAFAGNSKLVQRPAGSNTPADPGPLTAKATSYPVLVDGKQVDFEVYAIQDSTGNDVNYIKLRDMAAILNGTPAQFGVDWDQAAKSISLTTGAAYLPVGGELAAGDGGSKTAVYNSSKLLLNGAGLSLPSYAIAGNSYFVLRDLGAALGFEVRWDGKANSIVIETDKPYSGV